MYDEKKNASSFWNNFQTLPTELIKYLVLVFQYSKCWNFPECRRKEHKITNAANFLQKFFTVSIKQRKTPDWTLKLTYNNICLSLFLFMFLLKVYYEKYT